MKRFTPSGLLAAALALAYSGLANAQATLPVLPRNQHPNTPHTHPGGHFRHNFMRPQPSWGGGWNGGWGGGWNRPAWGGGWGARPVLGGWGGGLGMGLGGGFRARPIFYSAPLVAPVAAPVYTAPLVYPQPVYGAPIIYTQPSFGVTTPGLSIIVQ